MAKQLLKKERVRKSLQKLLDRTCQQWQDKKNDQPMRLYYMAPKANQRVGKLKLFKADPRGQWKRASELQILPSWTEDELAFFIHDRMMRLPILRGPFEE